MEMNDDQRIEQVARALGQASDAVWRRIAGGDDTSEPLIIRSTRAAISYFTPRDQAGLEAVKRRLHERET